MAKKFICPPQPATGAGTFSDDLVGFQLVQGGGLTQGNFEFTQSVTEKTNRNFQIGTFSEPITLDTLKIESIVESKQIVAKNYQVYPNYDLSDVTNFTLYGSLSKRLSVAIQEIINFFPASFESNLVSPNLTTGLTAYNIIYNSVEDETTFDINGSRLFNPFGIDYSENATINLSTREVEVSYLRNFTSEYRKYALYTDDGTFDVLFMVPTTGNSTSGVLTISVVGNPFSGTSTSTKNLIFRPNDYFVESVYGEKFDEVQKFLLNRLITPIYTCIFEIPQETDSGLYFTEKRRVTWPLDGKWNLDIRTRLFQNYLTQISEVATSFDEYKTNLLSRFLTTGSLKDFDTVDQKTEKIFQIYGRSFDETKNFIDALAYMNSVNYNVGNDIPSQLLKNLSQTLGWKTNISPISEESFLESVFGNTSEIEFPGYSKPLTPNEINYQFYRNLILNSAYLFKSKGTRKAIEALLRLIGAPEALIEFNENIYLVDQVINMKKFDDFFASISGGTYVRQTPVLDSTITFSILGNVYTGFTSQFSFQDVTTVLDDYPINDLGYPDAPEDTDDFFFQKGAGWFEVSPQHRSPEQIDLTNSIFIGANPNVQTNLEPFSYGEKYLERFRKFPFMEDGFRLTKTIDNKKSWSVNQVGLRRNSEGAYNAYYSTSDERLVLNVKNVDLFLNPAQGLQYDVWYMSNQYDYPIPQTGMSAPYPTIGGIDWTTINPQPKKLTFFEFAQTFWRNMINARDRQFNTDGHTSGYATLQSIWWLYLNSGQAINVPNDNFSYTNMINYLVGLGDYWIRLIEQMIPATTIWNGGYRYENSLFHRQKFVWRRQAGCQIIAIPCIPCQLKANLIPYDCESQIISCNLYPWATNPLITSFGTLLSNIVTDQLLTQGVNSSLCYQNTLTSTWYILLLSGTTSLVYHQFFQGYGFGNGGSPTNAQFITGIQNAMSDIFQYGIYYDLDLNVNPQKINFIKINCQPSPPTDYLEFQVGVQFNIACP